MLAAGALSDSSSGTRFGSELAYDIGNVAYGVLSCPIAMTGDVNNSGSLSLADISGLVNSVFKGGATPMPCQAIADVNCSGAVTATDIIGLVNYIFKGGPAPCDGCNLMPGTWPCP